MEQSLQSENNSQLEAAATGNDANQKTNDDNDSLPDNVTGAGKKLTNTAAESINQRGADLLNGGTELLRAGNGLFGLMGGVKRQQSGNMRLVANEGFKTINGLGDSLSRGLINVFQANARVGREVASRMADVVNVTANTGKKVTRLGGTLVTTPIGMGGDLADMATSAVTIPKNGSKLATQIITNGLLPMLGADEIKSEDDNNDNTPSQQDQQNR